MEQSKTIINESKTLKKMKINATAINMAKINQGILGGFLGRVGNVVGTAWKGKAVIRSRALHVHDPKTPKQLLARQRFAMLQNLAALVGTANIRAGFKAKARYMTEVNYFVKKNYDAITGSELDNLAVAYADVLVAEGSLPGLVLRGTVTSDDPGSAHIAWINNAGQAEASDADVVRILAVDPEQELTAVFSANRSAGSVDLDLPSFMTGHAVHFYLYCIGVDGFKISDSVYAGKVTIS